MKTRKDPHAVALGRKGGQAKTAKKLAALARNRKLRWPEKKSA